MRFRVGVMLVVSCLGACRAQETKANKEMSSPDRAIDDAAAAAKGKELVERFAAGKFAEAVASFDADMTKAFPEAKAEATWQKLVAQMGAFRSAEVSKTEHKERFIRAVVTTKFERATADLLVVLDASGHVSGFFVGSTRSNAPWVPPAYAKPASFTEEEVTVGDGPLALPGTLTLPKTGEKLPAVVLVHGSGPNDRDETIGALKPFKDLAWGLASRGLAVLRYEKVTKAHAAEWAAKVGDEITLRNETIDDALRGAALLRKHARVDPKKVFFLGHSQGALAAPRAATIDADLAGIVIMAGPTRRLEDVGLDQIEYIATLPGPNGEGAKKMIAPMQEAVKLVKSASLDAKTPKDKLPFRIPPAFWLDLRDYRPEIVAAGVAMPVLVLQGEADYQVTMVDFDGWKKGLAGKKNATLRSYPGLNHAFADCGSKLATPEDYSKPGSVEGTVVADIADWIFHP